VEEIPHARSVAESNTKRRHSFQKFLDNIIKSHYSMKEHEKQKMFR
jgi:hypothetical protein